MNLLSEIRREEKEREGESEQAQGKNCRPARRARCRGSPPAARTRRAGTAAATRAPRVRSGLYVALGEAGVRREGRCDRRQYGPARKMLHIKVVNVVNV